MMLRHFFNSVRPSQPAKPSLSLLRQRESLSAELRHAKGMISAANLIGAKLFLRVFNGSGVLLGDGQKILIYKL